MKKIIYPGSFDPVTLGHIDIVARGSQLFDKVYVCMGINTNKSYFFHKEKRLELLKLSFERFSNVEIVAFEGLTVDLCKRLDCHTILRGIRTTFDLEYEKAIADSNKKLFPEIETILLMSDYKVSGVSSTIVRELIRNQADLTAFLPKEILGNLKD